MDAPPAPSPNNDRAVLVKAAGVTAALAALGVGSFFAVNALTSNGDSSSTTAPQTVSMSTPAPVTPSTPPAAGNASSTASAQSGGGAASGGQSSAAPSTSTSDSASADQAAVSQLDEWASQGRASTTISEDSWGARLSSKWVGATDKDANHPQPYTAQEIKSEMEGLRATYGPDLRILKLSDAGLQNSAIKGRNGWMAVVVNSDTDSEDKAKAWCSAHFDGDISKCGEQHLNAPHDN